MKHLSVFALALAGLLAQPASAFEILGGSIALSYNNASDLDLKRAKLEGSIELGFGSKVSAQIDVVAHRLDTGGSTETPTSFGLHGIYRINPDFAVGVFAGRQNVDFNFGDSNYYGIEGAYEINKVALQAYYGRSKPIATPIDLDIYGISADYAFSPQWNVGLKYDVIDLGVFKISNTALRGTYTMQNSVSLFAEVGKIDVGLDDTFFGVGVSYGFGANKGATFNPRGSTATLGIF